MCKPWRQVIVDGAAGDATYWPDRPTRASLAIHGSCWHPHTQPTEARLHKLKRRNLTKLASLANLPCSGYWGSLGRHILVEAEENYGH